MTWNIKEDVKSFIFSYNIYKEHSENLYKLKLISDVTKPQNKM